MHRHTRGTTQIAPASRRVPLIGLQQALSTDAADAGEFYLPLTWCSSLRLGSDSKARASWLTPTAISLRMQISVLPSPSEPLLIVLESYHLFLKLSTKKCAPRGKMSVSDGRLSLPLWGRCPNAQSAAGADEVTAVRIRRRVSVEVTLYRTSPGPSGHPPQRGGLL